MDSRIEIYRELLKEATKLKRDGDYLAACSLLRVAFDMESPELRLDIRERLRLPVYLNFAGRPEEAWEDLLQVKRDFPNIFDQFVIDGKIYAFHKDDRNYDQALCALITGRFRYLAHMRDTVRKIEQVADFNALENTKYGRPTARSVPVTGTTQSGNPIFDISYVYQLQTFKRDILLRSLINDFEEITTLRSKLPTAKQISLRLKRAVLRGVSISKADNIAEEIVGALNARN